jgi:hypothetical protein
VDLDVSLICLYLLLELCVLHDQDLCLLRLVLQLRRQLGILKNRQLCRCLELFVIFCEQFGLSFLKLVELVFFDLVNFSDAFPILVVTLQNPSLSFSQVFSSQIIEFLVETRALD